MVEPKKKFTVVGIVTSIEFQKCKFYVQKLVKCFPNEYDSPVIRPLLNVEWKEFLWKLRRTVGGDVWTLEKNAVVLLNNKFLGDDVAIFQYATSRARMRVIKDFHCLGILELKDIFNKAIGNKRKFAYLTIAVEERCIGSLLFLLYVDHVPRTVKHFLRRCKSEKRGWVGRPLHRLVKGSWLQIGGFDLENRKTPCENYVVPHDRRGVLSTCNDEKHSNNTTQLVVSLAPTSWMDYKFVAFGQLIQGDEVLKKIETIETYYEAPKKPVRIWDCGEYNLDTSADPVTIMEIKAYFDNVDPYTGMPSDALDMRDVSSELSVQKYQKGLYCLDLDVVSYGMPKYLYSRPDPDQYNFIDHLCEQCSGHEAMPYVDDRVQIENNDAVRDADNDANTEVRQLLSMEMIPFKTEIIPSKTINLEKRQKLDIEHTPSGVVQIVESAMQSLSDNTQMKVKEPLIHHIVD